MSHAFRGNVHRVSADHDGELTIVFKAPSMYYDDVMAVGSLAQQKQTLYITVHTEQEVQEGGDHETGE